MTVKNKMKVEIWSDVICPFCYIGKRKFESALSQFPGAGDVEIDWKSFQLMPDLKTKPDKNMDQFLSEHKSISLSQARSLNDNVVFMAKQAGLIYNFDKAIPANSFNAHRLLHFAKQSGLQNEAKEKLLHAYFTDGKNIDDPPTLIHLGAEIGLDLKELKNVLESDQYASEVRQDIAEAQQLGVRGVPFFVFDRKVAISGAQNSEEFLRVLKETYIEWERENPQSALIFTEGAPCKPDGECK